MKRIISYCCLFFLSAVVSAQNNQANLVIVGGTPGGIMTAIAAAREGKSAIILERTKVPGGLPANGLGATDIATRGATTGLFKEFVDRIKQYYINRYGENSQQVQDCSDGYHFEPSVASIIFRDMLEEHKEKISLHTMRQFDANPDNITVQSGRITSIKILNRENGEHERYTADIFVDATYEGDLGAAAGVPFRIGRESRNEFNEIGAGKVYKYWDSELGSKETHCGYEGYESAGTTFQGDNAVQAYNYRLCLTNDKQIIHPTEKPKNYNREEYISLIDDVWTGRHTGVEMRKVTPEMLALNIETLKQGKPTNIPGDPWGIAKITNMVKLPNEKTDANNQHLALISTDLPEENWPWPTASWEWRDKYAQRLKDYTLGLLWFVQNDKALPKQFREACKTWGLAKTEYADNEYFPRQVYVREGRRFEGQYLFTANDALPVAIGQRPPLHLSAITASHYALDSHAVLKREQGRVHLDGFISYESAVYTVPYGVIIPKHVTNLLLPVPVSGTHIGFSTLRMEPCWMALGQAAGTAASLAIDAKVSVQDISINKLQQKLIAQNATLIYYKDVAVGDSDFPLAQKAGVHGYLPEWEAKLDEIPDAETLRVWSLRSGMKLPQNQTKREVLKWIFETTKSLKRDFEITTISDKNFQDESNFKSLLGDLGVN